MVSKSYKRKRIPVLFCFLSMFIFEVIAVMSIYMYFSNQVILKEDVVDSSIPEDPIPTKSELSLIMVGDSLIHSAVYGDAKTDDGYDFSPCFDNVRDYIKSYDLAFYNQESILGGEELGLSTYPRFNSPYAVGDAFREMGFNLVSLANNHTLDRGEAAIINSRKYWNQFPDIIVSGSNTSYEEQNDIKILEMNGIRYTMLAYTDLTNGLSTNGKEYLVNHYSEERVKKDIESVHDQVDLLMVSMHFGEEYKEQPTAKQKKIAEYLSSLGVDIVIGHHPHIVEPIEFIGNTMVIYSLGNFISAQRGVERLTGLMASVKVVKEIVDEKTVVSLENPSAELVYTSSNYDKQGYRHNFKLYRYQDLTDAILGNYLAYQERFLGIVNLEK